MVIFYGFDPFFWTQWDPIDPKMDPRGSPPWFAAVTVTSIFLEKSMTAGWSKIRIFGMVNFHGFDPFFGPNVPHSTQDEPYEVTTLIWRYNRNFHF